MTDLIQISVTPPGLDKPDVRRWMEDVARGSGFGNLTWKHLPDRSLLFGAKTNKDNLQAEVPRG